MEIVWVLETTFNGFQYFISEFSYIIIDNYIFKITPKWIWSTSMLMMATQKPSAEDWENPSSTKTSTVLWKAVKICLTSNLCLRTLTTTRQLLLKLRSRLQVWRTSAKRSWQKKSNTWSLSQLSLSQHSWKWCYTATWLTTWSTSLKESKTMLIWKFS